MSIANPYYFYAHSLENAGWYHDMSIANPWERCVKCTANFYCPTSTEPFVECEVFFKSPCCKCSTCRIWQFCAIEPTYGKMGMAWRMLNAL